MGAAFNIFFKSFDLNIIFYIRNSRYSAEKTDLRILYAENTADSVKSHRPIFSEKEQVSIHLPDKDLQTPGKA